MTFFQITSKGEWDQFFSKVFQIPIKWYHLLFIVAPKSQLFNYFYKHLTPFKEVGWGKLKMLRTKIKIRPLIYLYLSLFQLCDKTKWNYKMGKNRHLGHKNGSIIPNANYLYLNIMNRKNTTSPKFILIVLLNQIRYLNLIILNTQYLTQNFDSLYTWSSDRVQ